MSKQDTGSGASLAGAFCVYILHCRDGSYYVGSTSDLATRVATHRAGNGAAHTAARLPLELVYSEEHETLAAAIAREKQIKGWSRAKKESLIAGYLERLRALARCRGCVASLSPE